jgi:purine nucleoside permease
VLVRKLLNPRPMLSRTFYCALLVSLLHGSSIADEAPVFTPPTADHPLKVKVVIVAMFEVGADTSDIPGEFQFWVERRKLDHVIGATLSSSTYWHGKLLNRWAHDWVKYWTDEKGEYCTTAMEDTGTMQALTNLAKAGRVDLNRVLVLRTASNFDSPPPGVSAAQDLKDQEAGRYSAYIPSLEAAFTVGNRVASELIDHWDTYSAQIPIASGPAKSK